MVWRICLLTTNDELLFTYLFGFILSMMITYYPWLYSSDQVKHGFVRWLNFLHLLLQWML